MSNFRGEIRSSPLHAKRKQKTWRKKQPQTFSQTPSWCIKNSLIVWQDTPLGKTTVSEAVYVKQLYHTKHPLFLDCPHFTNSSLRNYHVERLSEAGAPLVVQQASLAQNVKAYARGAHSLPLQMKVANIVSGKQRH